MFLTRNQAINPCQFHHPSPISKKREREIEVRKVERSRRDRSEIGRDDTPLITQLIDPILLVLSCLLLCRSTTV